MSYTFWHCGVLIGESDLEEASGNPGQRGGTFWPTAYGLQVFPRLTGMLTAAHALKMHMDANGLSEDSMNGDQVEELLDTPPSGACSATSKCGRRTAARWSSRPLRSVT